MEAGEASGGFSCSGIYKRSSFTSLRGKGKKRGDHFFPTLTWGHVLLVLFISQACLLSVPVFFLVPLCFLYLNFVFPISYSLHVVMQKNRVGGLLFATAGVRRPLRVSVVQVNETRCTGKQVCSVPD